MTHCSSSVHAIRRFTSISSALLCSLCMMVPAAPAAKDAATSMKARTIPASAHHCATGATWATMESSITGRQPRVTIWAETLPELRLKALLPQPVVLS